MEPQISNDGLPMPSHSQEDDHLSSSSNRYPEGSLVIRGERELNSSYPNQAEEGRRNSGDERSSYFDPSKKESKLMSDRTFDVSQMDTRLAKAIRINKIDSGLDQDTALDNNSKNMKIMDTQDNSQGIFGGALEK